MTPYLHPHHGWQVECPECKGYGSFHSHNGADYYGGYLAHSRQCDTCAGEGHTDPHIDDFDGATVLHNGRVITVTSSGYALYELDVYTPIDMADLLPVPALLVAA